MFFITKSKLMNKCKENYEKCLQCQSSENYRELVEVIDKQYNRFALDFDSSVIASGVKPHVKET